MNPTDKEVLETELESLKAKADLLGITYHPSIGLEKLSAKIAEKLAEEPVEAPKEGSEVSTSVAKENTTTGPTARQQALELIRVRVACMNPTKKNWDGEIFTAGNSKIGTVRKYVPFNQQEWHVPRIILNMMKARKVQLFRKRKDKSGNDVTEGYLVNEFNIEELPPLTKKELDELARKQSMSKSV